MTSRYGLTKRVTKRILAPVLVALALSLAAPVAGAPSTGGFSAHVTNTWFPLVPGSIYVYRGIKDGKASREVMTVSHEVRTVDGAPCAVVKDKLYLRGRLEERTTDWYTQDRGENVWYYGEETAELDVHGRVKSTEGTWLAGRNGAKPGIYFPGHPKVGQSARQEYYKGHAEDHFRVVRFRAAVKVPWGSTKNALLTKEWTPLEPAVLDHKFYVRGVGNVLEQSVKGPNERNALVSFKRG